MISETISNQLSPKKITFQAKDQLIIAADAWGPPENPPVLLAHGGGQTRHAWGNTASELAKQGWYAVAIDLRGHGESDWHPDGKYGVDEYIADIRIIASTFKKPPAYIGASLGGATGMVAEAESEKSIFSSLTLVDIAHRYEQEGVNNILDFMSAKMEEGFANLEEVRDLIAAYLPHREAPSDLNGLEKNLRLREDGRYYWHWDPKQFMIPEEVERPESRKRLTDAARALKIPTLLVRGRMSDVISIEGAKEFLKLAPHAKFVDVKDAGHMVAGDNNDLFTDSIIEFLAPLRKDA